MARNSIVHLAKGIKFDRGYKNICNYTDVGFLDLVSNTQKVQSFYDLAYVRHDKPLDLEINYDKALQCNYLCFQNPTYSTKWFYAWIDKVEYISERNVRIHFTIDVWATWSNKINKKACFVVREHVADDTLGLNTYPENLESGEYIINRYSDVDLGEMYIVMAVTKEYSENVEGGLYGGVYSGLKYIAEKVTDYTNINNFLHNMAQNTESGAIVSIFMLPHFILKDVLNTSSSLLNGREIASQTEESFSKPSAIDTYVPHNKKLLTYPYSYMMVSNNAGSNTTYNYEDFHTTRTGLTNECLFDLFGTICPGGSLKLVPKYYKGATQNMDESLTGCKFPICNWNSDVYINWLTQNSANLAYSKIDAGINIASGIVEGLTGNVASGINKAYSSGKSLGNQMLQQKLHELIPPTAQGNVNAGDVMQGIDSKNSTSTSHKPKNTYSIYDMSIKREFAQKIDDYFTKYGYKVNKVKIPEFTSRTYWNYVEIGQGEAIGYGEIPADAMETINNIFRNGVTIWHHHSQLGDFSLHNWL